MSPRGHELISDYYDAARRIDSARGTLSYDIAVRQLRDAFGALEAYIISLGGVA